MTNKSNLNGQDKTKRNRKKTNSKGGQLNVQPLLPGTFRIAIPEIDTAGKLLMDADDDLNNAKNHYECCEQIMVNAMRKHVLKGNIKDVYRHERFVCKLPEDDPELQFKRIVKRTNADGEEVNDLSCGRKRVPPRVCSACRNTITIIPCQGCKAERERIYGYDG